MTTSSVDHGPHIADGDLVRLLDGECSVAEKELFDSHIGRCPECQANAASLKRASALFSESVLELDTREPGMQSKPRLEIGRRYARPQHRVGFTSSRVLRVAAVLALTVIVFTATPARAWLVRGWEAVKSLVVSDIVEPQELDDTPAEQPSVVSSILRFMPRGSEFRLEFTAWQAGGALVLLLDSTATASAGILEEESNDELILLPNGLRIRNSSGSTTSYEVRLPLTLSVVEVSVAGNTVLRLDVQTQRGPQRRELSLIEDTEG